MTAADCEIKGLVGNDELETQPTVAYETPPDTSKVGTVAIKASGAVVSNGGNYEKTITYVPGKLTINRPVDPTVSVTGVSLNRDSLVLTVGETFPFSAIVMPSNATDKRVTWASGNSTIAIVSSNGIVTANSAGTTTITVTTWNGRYSSSCTVTVTVRQYTITYDANSGGGMMDSSTATDGKAFVLPGCSFVPPEGKVFDTWAIGSAGGPQVKPGSTYTFTGDTTVYAVWKDLQYNITGIVRQDGTGLSGATVQLKQGAVVIAQQTTDTDGSFTFTGIVPGVYNLVAEKDGITMTVMQKITSSSASLTIALPTGKTNSVVEIKDPATPPVIEGELENVFQDEAIYTPEDKQIVKDGGAVEFKLV